jgi:hypothetical protein
MIIKKRLNIINSVQQRKAQVYIIGCNCQPKNKLKMFRGFLFSYLFYFQIWLIFLWLITNIGMVYKLNPSIESHTCNIKKLQ